jgi:hypothetical protein
MMDFLEKVWSKTGPYCVAFRRKDKNGFLHKAVSTYSAAVSKANWGVKMQWDVYFCISSLKELEWIDAQDKPHIRKKENCRNTKVFVLDVDVAEDSPRKYKNKTEALEALEKFNGTMGLKKPIVVDSGYGLHVYWVLDKAIPSDKWEMLADYFKAVAVQVDPKLAADTSRISDSAGVLRLPGTFNFKKPEDPKQVKIIQWSEESIGALEFGGLIKAKATELQIPFHKHTKKEKRETLVSLGMDTPHDMRLVFKRCNFAKQYAKNVKTASEAEWYRMLGLAKHLYHPDLSMKQIVHMLSKGHPGYDADATEAKFEQVRQAQTGPTMCKTFRELRPEWCEGCPFANVVTTPAMLDMVDLPDANPLKTQAKYTDEEGRAIAADIELTPIPKPYFRGRDGGIYMNIDGGSIDGKQDDPAAVKKIYEYDIYPTARLQNEDTGEEDLEVHLFLPQDGKRIIRVPNQVVIEPKSFASYLTSRGVLLKPHEVQPLVGYMVDYAREIQKKTPAKNVFNRFGWRDVHEPHGSFVLGDGVIMSDGSFRPCMTAARLEQHKEYASSKGALKAWSEAFDAVRLYSPMAYQFLAALAFSTPLFSLTPYHGVIYNLLGRSGIGKSTALEFMTSVFGAPMKTHILQMDNQIPVFNKIGYLNSLPVAFGEITQMPSDRVADFAYSVSEGRGKERADRSGNTKTNFTTWSTSVATCSNLSLYEKIGASKQGNAAPAYRIFETQVEEVDINNKPKIESAIRILSGNYGIAGRLYMQHVITKREEIAERLYKAEESIDRQFRLRTAERFWGGMFSVVQISTEICNELGFHKLNKELLLEWAYNETQKARVNLEETQGNAVGILSDFLDSNRHAILRVDDGKINSFGLSTTPTRELHIRLELSAGKPTAGYISIPAFKRYCQINRIEYGWIVKDLHDMKVLKDGTTSKRLGAGTAWSGAPVGVLSLDFGSRYLNEDIDFGELLKTPTP